MSYRAWLKVDFLFGRLRYKDCKFKVSLGYIARPCLKKRNVYFLVGGVEKIYSMSKMKSSKKTKAEKEE
jgi:hypothetical protein